MELLIAHTTSQEFDDLRVEHRIVGNAVIEVEHGGLAYNQWMGVGRQFGGIMAKPWRMVALSIGAWTTLGLIWTGRPIQLLDDGEPIEELVA